jgi:hypothetical protein
MKELTVTETVALPKTEAAIRRLEQALGRLDQRLANQPSSDLFIAGELKSARAEYKELEELTRSVSERLDATIGRLRQVLTD